MSGAYTHLAVANEARTVAKKTDIRGTTKLALGNYLRYVELGAVGPDYPYLSLKPHQSQWADEMHYRNTATLIRIAVTEIRKQPEAVQGKLIAWLFGMASHIATDMTIHPVVELKVGPYNGNESAHRKCEMHQDAYIFPRRMNVGETTYSEHIKTGLGACGDAADPDKLDPDIAALWKRILNATYPQLAGVHPADPDAWHKGFRSVLLTMASVNHLVPFARHVAARANLAYPLAKDVDPQFVRNLKTPEGAIDFDALFDRARDNVIEMWRGLDRSLSGADAGALAKLEDWNLDTGRSLTTGQLVFWRG